MENKIKNLAVRWDKSPQNKNDQQTENNKKINHQKNQDKNQSENKSENKEKKQSKKTLFSINKIVLLIVVLILFFTVPQLNQPAMSTTSAIVTMLCVDKEEENFSVSVTALSPSQGNQENQQVFSSQGVTLGEAIDNLSLTLGKEMGFAQCDIMAVGENLCQSGIMQALDYMTRTRKVGRNAVLVNFSGQPADFAQAVVDLSQKKGLKLAEIISYDRRYILSQDSNIESFYLGYYSDIPLGILPKLTLTDSEQNLSIEVSSSDEGSLESEQDSGSAGGDSAEGDAKKYLVNDGTISVLKNGKFYTEVPLDIVKKLNLLLNKNDKGTVTVTNVQDELYTDATVTASIMSKKTWVWIDFEDGVPTYKVSVKLNIIIDEIVEQDPSDKLLVQNQKTLTTTLKNMIEEKVTADIKEAFDYCAENEVDLIGIYQYFYRFRHKEWLKYLDEAGTEDYLSGVRLSATTSVVSDY